VVTGGRSGGRGRRGVRRINYGMPRQEEFYNRGIGR